MAEITMSDITHAWHTPGQRNIYTFEHPKTGRSIWGNETFEECAQREDGLVRMPIDDAIDDAENARAKAFNAGKPQECTAEQFQEALEVLPPVQWTARKGTMSFKMSEAMSGTLTACYVKVQDKYFVLTDSYATKHEELVEKCLTFMKGQ